MTVHIVSAVLCSIDARVVRRNEPLSGPPSLSWLESARLITWQSNTGLCLMRRDLKCVVLTAVAFTSMLAYLNLNVEVHILR